MEREMQGQWGREGGFMYCVVQKVRPRVRQTEDKLEEGKAQASIAVPVLGGKNAVQLKPLKAPK